MQISITGADVRQNGDGYEVVYQGNVVFRDKLRTICVITALNKDYLAELANKSYKVSNESIGSVLNKSL